MELKKFTETFAVSPQIATADLADIKKAGFRSIICNRPDGEGYPIPVSGDGRARIICAVCEAHR